MKNEELEKVRATPIEEVARELGMRVVRHTALCPFHNDKNPSLHFHRGKNRYKCFACGASGDVVDLVMRYNNVGFKEAVAEILEKKGEGLEEDDSHTASPQKTLKTPDIEYLSTLIAHPVLTEDARRFLFDERRIDPRVVEWCGLTSIDVPTPCWRWGKAFYDAPSLLIPYRDVDGRLLTVQGRRLEELKIKDLKNKELKIKEMGDEDSKHYTPRFRFPPGSQTGMYNKPVLRRLGDGDELWITEGPSDCWAMLSAGRKAVAIPSATSLTMDDIALLRDGVSRGATLHMMPDNDRPGMGLFQALKRFFPRLRGHVLPEGVKDFGELWKKEREGQLASR